MSGPTPRQPLESSAAEGFARLTPTGGKRGGPDVMQPLGYGIFKVGKQKLGEVTTVNRIIGLWPSGGNGIIVPVRHWIRPL